MPALNKIESLENILSHWCVKYILKVLRQINSNTGRNLLKDYLIKSINMNVRHKLVSHILSVHIYELELSQKCNLFEVLADSSLDEIDISRSGSVFVEEAFYLYRVIAMGNFKNITRLGINCSVKVMVEEKYIPEINSIIYNPLSSMKNLKSVTLQEIADSLILETLGNSCPYLEYLDVKDSCLVKDCGVFALIVKNAEVVSALSREEILQYSGPLNACTNHLTYLGISGADVGIISIILSLIFLPNLRSFGSHTNAASVSNVLLYLRSKKAMEPLQLVELWDDDLTCQELSMLNCLCPNLKNLYTNEFSLRALHKANYLNIESIRINCDYKNCSDDLLSFLSVYGSQLTSLCLDHSVNFNIHLLFLIELTPSLKEVTAPLCMNKEEEETSKVKWEFLKIAKVCVNSIFCLKLLIKYSPVLVNLNLKYFPEVYSGESFLDINDTFIIEALQNDCLGRLEVFNLEECALSIVGLDTILENCSKLRQIGKLFYWEGIKKKDLQLLKERITKSNWNLKVIMKEEYGDMAW